MRSIPQLVKNCQDLAATIDELLDESKINEAKECISQIQTELNSLAYDVLTMKSRVKIAGKNLTEAFEQLMDIPQGDN